jgi:hypothetical protein
MNGVVDTPRARTRQRRRDEVIRRGFSAPRRAPYIPLRIHRAAVLGILGATLGGYTAVLSGDVRVPLFAWSLARHANWGAARWARHSVRNSPEHFQPIVGFHSGVGSFRSKPSEGQRCSPEKLVGA